MHFTRRKKNFGQSMELLMKTNAVIVMALARISLWSAATSAPPPIMRSASLGGSKSLYLTRTSPGGIKQVLSIVDIIIF